MKTELELTRAALTAARKLAEEAPCPHYEFCLCMCGPTATCDCTSKEDHKALDDALSELETFKAEAAATLAEYTKELDEHIASRSPEELQAELEAVGVVFENDDEVAEEIFNKLSSDIGQRKGIKHEWAEIPEFVMVEEVKPAWLKIIKDTIQTHRRHDT